VAYFRYLGMTPKRIEMTCRKKLDAGIVREFLLLFKTCSIKETEFLD
jgi:hypothetical protein